MYGYRKCAEPGCENAFIPKSSRNRFCLRHRKTKPRDPEHYRKYGTTYRQPWDPTSRIWWAIGSTPGASAQEIVPARIYVGGEGYGDEGGHSLYRMDRLLS